MPQWIGVMPFRPAKKRTRECEKKQMQSCKARVNVRGVNVYARAHVPVFPLRHLVRCVLLCTRGRQRKKENERARARYQASASACEKGQRSTMTGGGVCCGLSLMRPCFQLCSLRVRLSSSVFRTASNTVPGVSKSGVFI